ncbi:MAG: M48 family metalloprotease, partial [Pyrinomonadaceae bacterium]|nr:M48 family metalloprotease [Pyrinomonadaceae bacterium]
MFKRSQRSWLAGLIALAVLFTSTLPAATVFAQDKSEEKKEKDKKKEETKPKLTKEEKEYQKIKKFSVDLYMKDAEFRDSVEDSYLQKQREHSEYAYYINTRDSTDEQVTRNGDKLKVEDTLYDNPLAQDYVNRVGQSLVPANSQKLYAFKITLNPIPEARSLSTGTIYVSSGLLSHIDNEAQLAYVLGHEIAHVEKDHWKEDVLVAEGIQPYNEKQQKKRALFGALIGAAAGAVAGAAGASASSAIGLGAFTALVVAPSVLKLIIRDAVTSWDRLQEDEADQLGMKYMLDRNYDVNEVPKFYASLRRTSNFDSRAGLGFIADKSRITEREEQVKTLIGGYGGAAQKNLFVGSVNLADRRVGKSIEPTRDASGREAAAEKAISGALSPEIQAKLASGELIGTSAEFESVMSGLKRDNGVRAFYFDMFHMSRENLEESLRIRSNDPYAHYFYGKVLKLTARTQADKSRALSEFVRAIELDRRRVVPESHLYRALALIETKDPAQMRDIVNGLKEYVNIYQRQHSGSLPPSMDVIYDYMQEAGEMNWT